MGKSARLKRERRAQRQIVTPPKINLNSMSRRSWIKAAGATLILAAAGKVGYELFRPTTYVEAFDDEGKRTAWLDSLNDRPYITKKIATPQDLDHLRRTKDGYVPPDGTFAATMANNDEQVPNGAMSTLYVYRSCFDPMYSRLKDAMGIVIENVIDHHELLHGDHFFKGIDGVHPSKFLQADGSLDRLLFLNVSEVVCYRSEWDGLADYANGSKFLTYYRDALKKVAFPHFLQALAMSKDGGLTKFITEHAWFKPPKYSISHKP